LGKLFDIISFNEYVGWYDGLPEKCDRVEWTFSENKPVIVSEFGGECVYGLRGEKTDRFTEDYQEDLYNSPASTCYNACRGWRENTMDSEGFQITTPSTSRIQDDFNRKGLVSDKGQKKKAFT